MYKHYVNNSGFHRKTSIPTYGIRLSHIFEIPSIPVEKASISVEILGVKIQIQEVKNLVYRNFSFEMPSTSIEIQGFRSK